MFTQKALNVHLYGLHFILETLENLGYLKIEGFGNKCCIYVYF